MSRKTIFALTGIIIFLLLAAALIAFAANFSIFNNSAPTGPVVHWSGLPVPVASSPDWTSFTSSTSTNDALVHDGLIWAATDGGVVVWDEPANDYAKFTVEHGLADNEVTAVSVGPDGTIWFGTTTGGASHFDGSTWHTYTTDDGLPSNTVHDITTAPDGTVWAATEAGVGQFNGRRWYIHDRTRSLLQLPGSHVRVVAAGREPGTVWVGTDQGVAFYNGRLWQNYEQVGSHAINDIFDLALSNNGIVWAATGGGLKRLIGDRWELFSLPDGLVAEEVRTVTAVTDQIIWVSYASAHDGITQLDFSSGTPAATNIALPEGHDFTAIRAITPTAAGHLISTDQGVWQRSSSGDWLALPQPNDLPITNALDIVTMGNELWAAGSGGIGRWQDGTWHSFDESAGLPVSSAFALSVDMNNQIWAAFPQIRDGLAVFDAAANRWQLVGCGLSGPPSARVRTAVSDNNGNLWFATTRGLAQFDGAAWHIHDETDGLPSASIQTLARDAAGAIWAGTDAGLTMRNNGGWQPVNNHDIRELSIGPDGLVWMVTDEEILRWDGSAETAVPNPPADQVFDFLATDNGFWIATSEGIFLLKGQQYVAHYTTEDGLGSNRVTALRAGQDGTLWAGNGNELRETTNAQFGTFQQQSTYLSHFDGRGWQSHLLTPPAGTNHPVITDIATAESGEIWLATLNGISRFAADEWHTFGTIDGLPEATVLQTAVSPNHAWAVTNAGIAQFDTQSERWDIVPELQDVWQIPGGVQIVAGANGRIWAGGEDTIVWSDGQGWETSTVPQAVIRALTIDADGRLWVAATLDNQQQLGIFDGQEWTWLPIRWSGGAARGDVELLAFGGSGRLWLGTELGIYQMADPLADSSASLVTQEIREPQFITILADGTPLVSGRYQKAVHLLDANGIAESIEIPLPDVTHVFTAVQTPDRTIWLGTDQGSMRYLPDGTWEFFYTPPNEEDQSITTLTEAADGAIWAGTFGGKVVQLVDGRVAAEFVDGFPQQNNPVGVLLFDDAGQLWKGVFGGAIARLNGRTWERFTANVDVTETAVNSFVIDNNGLAWLGTDNGLFTITTTGATECRFQPAGREIFGHALAADAQSGIWAVHDKFLWQGDPSGFEQAAALILPITAVAPDGSVWTANKDALIRIVNNNAQEVELDEVTGELTTLAFEQNGRIWLGTTEGAWVLENGRWAHYTTQDGLANNHVTHIQISDDGTVWFATLGGISQKRP